MSNTERPTLSLYDINAELEAVMLQITELELEGEPVPAELAEQCETLLRQLDDKRHAYCAVIRNAEARHRALTEEANRFKERARTEKALVARIKDYLSQDLSASGEVTAVAGPFRLGIARSQPAVVLDEDFQPPDAYARVTVEPDKPAIRKALQAGEVIEGAELEERQHLRIRIA